MIYGIDKDFQQLMEQVYGPLVPNGGEMTETEKLKEQIKVLEKKLSFLEELEQTKSPAEEAYRRWWGEYPSDDNGWEIDNTRWRGFRVGYNYAQKDYKVGEYQEPVKNKMPLYYRFREFGCLIPDSEGFCKIVKEFLMDEGVIEDESGEYITFTLQKYLLDTPND